MIERISQSFIKEFREYEDGKLCGNLIRERWVNGRLLDDPEDEPGAKELGAFFEFITTGNLPKAGAIPVAQYKEAPLKKAGGKTEKLKYADMMSDYRYAHDNAVLTKEYLTAMKFEIVHIGKQLTAGRFTGQIDLIVRYTGDVPMKIEGSEDVIMPEELIILDVKYTKWLKDNVPGYNKHGWKWSEVQKIYHGTQAIQYYYIGQRKMKFFFLVIGATEEHSVEFFYIPIQEWMVEAHLSEGNALFEKFKFLANTDLFTPYPRFNICRKCPIREGCKDRHHFPVPRMIDITKSY